MKNFIVFIVFFNVFLGKAQDNSEAFDYNTLYGTWRIDSTAEDLTFNKRDAVNEEFFVFNEFKFVRMLSIEGEEKRVFTLGSYEIVNDSLKIDNLNGSPGMNFAFRIQGDFIELNGGFPISANNPRKPTFFLGRVEEQ